MPYSPSYPLSSTSMCGSVTQITTNWDAIQDWWGVEHGTFSASTSGGHTPGKVGLLAYTTASAITAATNPGTGALGYASDLGIFYTYASGGWERLTQDEYSRVHKAFGVQTIAPTAWTQITSASATASGTYDTLDEETTGTVTISAAGFYLLIGSIRWPATTTNYQQATAIYKNAALLVAGRLYGGHAANIPVFDTVSLAAGDTIKLYGYHTHSTSADIVRGYLSVHRIS